MMMLAVDLDDTVADLLGALRPLAAAQLGCAPEDLGEPADYRLADWGLGGDGYRRLFEWAVVEDGLLERLEPHPGAVDTLGRLADAGWQLCVVTARAAEQRRSATAEVLQTARWLDAVGLDGLPLHFTADKTQVGWDVLLDDSPTNLGAGLAAGRQVVAFHQGYNADVPVPRIRRFVELPGVLAGLRLS